METGSCDAYAFCMQFLGSPQAHAFAKTLRKRLTPQEEVLWEELRRHACRGIKFRRQVPIGNFIADFYCHSAKLIIEIDGDIHKEQKEYDAYRQDILESKQFIVIRFTNDDIEANLKGVLESIRRCLDSLSS